MELSENKALLAEYRKQAKELVSQMTLEEKVSQTLYRAPAIERLGIPAYNWWNEALHGVARAGTATVFPQAIGMAAAFDEDFMEQVAEAISTEGRAKFNMQKRHGDRDIYKGLTFWAPNINIFRDPRWGRGQETFGEDPYLTSRLGVRFIKGLQGHDEKYLKAAACAKHFAVHSGPESLRHSFNAKVSMQDMRETYLAAFQACVTEGHVEAVMGAYNRVNGEPCCGSPTLLLDILRKEWGFEGHVVSDCWAIKDFHEGHGVTRTATESAAMAMNNGCDLNCGDLFANLLSAVQDGRVDEKRLDEALVSLFSTRLKLGILKEEKQTPFDAIPYSVVDSDAMRALSREAAQRGAVLLKNEGGLLPLDKKKYKTVGVVGPNADSRRALVGNYEGTSSRYITVLEGIQDYLGEDCRVLYSQGCALSEKREPGLRTGKERLAELKEVCALSDVVIACMGLDAELEGEEGDTGNEFPGGDKPDLNLPGAQEEVLRVIADSGKPAVLVLLSGSALAVNFAEEHIPAILQGWYCGAQGGRAIANLLFGEANPQGRLPITFYRSAEELPEFTDYSMENRTYRYMKQDALYPFGYGLSYTDFTYTEAALSGEEIGENGLEVSVTVENTGHRTGTETVQVYVKALLEDGFSHVPNAQLKGICKCTLAPGEKQRVCVRLPKKAFALYDEEGRLMLHAGEYRVYVGGQGPDERSTQLTGKTVAQLRAVVKSEERM